MTENPLTEALPDSLDDLFSRDPLKLSEVDLRRIVEELRRMRKNFLLSENAPAKPKKAPKAAPISKEKAAELSLDELDL
jgi:hypothetical protein